MATLENKMIQLWTFKWEILTIAASWAAWGINESIDLVPTWIGVTLVLIGFGLGAFKSIAQSLLILSQKKTEEMKQQNLITKKEEKENERDNLSDD